MSQSVSILGCGWLGLPLAEHLLRSGYLVKGSTTHADKLVHLREKGISPYRIDLSSEETIDPDFFSTDILVVTVPPRSKSQAPGAYLSQIKKVIHQLKQSSVKQLVYTSSTSVYPDRSGLFNEASVSAEQVSANAELVEVENLFLALSSVAVTVIRLGGLTGGSRLLVRHFAGKQNLKSGNYPVNLIHQEDAVRVIQFVIEKKFTGIFNACSPVHPFKKDFYTQLAQRFQMPLPAFSEDDKEEGKTIDVSKLEGAGYVFSFRDPYAYSYDQDLQ